MAVQCGSFWSGLSYDLFRLSRASGEAAPILNGHHAIWFGADYPYQVKLGPDELLIELRDRSIDAGIRIRAHVLHFVVGPSGMERVDPVALKPQDFVDEWLTRPWTEMQSRSAQGGLDKLQKWHEFLAGDFVAGDFDFAQACAEKAGQWQIGVDLRWIKGKELPEALTVYFLVQQLEQYRFEMTGISIERQEGCPGGSPPDLQDPSLFPIEKKLN